MRGESLADTAKVISSYCDFIAVRINDHEKLLEIADNSTVPVINALTLLEHPTQALADVYTIRQHKRDISNAKIAFVGDISQNTANSLMLTATKLGADVNLVGPKGYQPNNRCYTKAKSHSKVHLMHSIEEGLDDVDVIYTDTFVSMGRESSAEKRRKLFAPYQVTNKMLKFAKPNVIVMHPLPAHRGEEIAADVIDGKHSVVWEQVRNKLLLEKALLVYLSNGR